ncbi:Rieske (2Fe-2S) protein [Archangium violaceum]|uniref:QcrA and Rieske domain-containing protein n=1 Tax=Archangium violaceum TaxID=83451 RepID=UPI0019503B76|nr:Rieske (2Fe-2S) protein [Archangium violaceum]QRN97890.1 Rieske (2Fe-2S) protein [Archangium violaceum]
MSTSRRGFLRGLVGAGAGAAAAGLPGCAPDISPAPVLDAQKESDGTVILQVARYPDLTKEGGAVTLRVPGEQPLLVMHTAEKGANEYKVVSAICTHSGCPLGFQDGEAICPCHLSRFSTDGKVTQAPAKAPLTKYEASFDGVLLTIDFAAGEEGFPSVQNGKIFFPFSSFPELQTAGGRVQGVPEGYGKLIFVFALEGGAYAAVDSLCTHQQCPVSYDESAGDLLCPCHNSRFTKTGDVTRGPDPSGAITIGPLKKFTATSDATGVTLTIS